jgi:hypothetical protein
MKRQLAVFGILFVVSLVMMEAGASPFSPYVDEKDNITRPKDYREKRVYLGGMLSRKRRLRDMVSTLHTLR